MAPELPPRVVGVDLRFQEGALHGAVEYVEVKGEGLLRVRWDESPPPGFFPVCGGVAFVEETDRIIKATPDKDVLPSALGDSRYRWIQGLLPKDRWMMLVLVLPEEFTITDPHPLPADAKDFGGRLALYWRLKADEFGSTEAEWTLKAFDGNIQSEAERMNALVAKSKRAPAAADADVIVEDTGRSKGRAANGETEITGKTSPAMRILLALIASPVLVATIGLAYQRCGGSDSIPYSGRVIDAATRQVVPNAKVSVATEGPPLIDHTDSDGIFQVTLKRPVGSARIRVDMSGYEVFDRNVSLSRTSFEDVRLTSKPTPTPTPTPSTKPSPGKQRKHNNNRAEELLNSRPSNKPN